MPNLELINGLKADLYSTIKNTILKDATAGARDFDLMYPKKMISNIKPIEGIKNIFNTNIDNSVFNQLEPEEAYSRGDVFFTEYLTFNKDAEVEEREKNSHIPKQVYRLTEINFNQKANH